MVYRVIGLMSGSSLDGLDIAYVHLHDNAGNWKYEIVNAECYPYPAEWINKLKSATKLSALEYQLLHTEYGHYLGRQVVQFVNEHQLDFKVQLVASHGHTSFHVPQQRMTAQLGDGSAIAAQTGLPVVSDLRSLDLALGGQGAPIVPIGEKLLLNEYELFLNLGGIANISCHFREDNTTSPSKIIAFDVCPTNRVLNHLSSRLGMEYDSNGSLAAGGTLNQYLLDQLNSLDYYSKPFPKSLANEFGTDIVVPMIEKLAGILENSQDREVAVRNALRTYVEHICIQIKKAVGQSGIPVGERNMRMLVTGGGTYNAFMVERLQTLLKDMKIKVTVPEDLLIQYKEALVMALMGVLRWREENNTLSSVTGASKDSIGGAIWMGMEA